MPVLARGVKRALDVVWWTLLVGSVVAVAVIATAIALGARPYVAFPVGLVVHGTWAVAGSAQRASVVRASGQLRLRPSAEVVALGLGFVVVGVSLVLVVLAQLRTLMAEALAGSPFGPSNPRRVRLIGVSILLAEAAHAAVVLAGSTWAQRHLSGAGTGFRASFPLDPAVVGVGVVVVLLAEVFRIGAALQADHDLTV